jgi:SAM-dependent methyltransferase
VNRTYWDDLAEGFDRRVLQVSECDTDGVLLSVARRRRGRRKTAVDLGCGIGAVTRAVAPFYGATIGIDFAPKLLQRARELTSSADIEYRLADVARPADLPSADVVFCVNVLLHRRADVRDGIAANVARAARSGGNIVVVVPSLESALRTYQTVLRCQVAGGRLAAREVLSMTDGIVQVGASPTKHYLHDELVQLFEGLDVHVDAVRRLQFPWSVEIDDPPDWLGEPTPWDWLLEGTVGETGR